MKNEILDFITSFFSEMNITCKKIKPPYKWDDSYDNGLRKTILDDNSYLDMKKSFPDFVKTNIRNQKSIFILKDIFDCYAIFIPDEYKDDILIFSPYIVKPASVDHIAVFISEKHIASSYKTYITQYYSSIPYIKNRVEFELMLRTLSIKLWQNPELKYFEANDTNAIAFQSEIKAEKEFEFSKQIDILEKRYYKEDLGMKYISEGNNKKAISIFVSPSFGSLEQRTSNSLRSLKNYLIVANTLFRKSAQLGGVHPIYLDDLSRKMSIKIENMTELTMYNDLLIEMITKYCNMVNNFSISGYSPTIGSAINFINSNLESKLTLSNIADKFNINKSYLSSRFKKEVGENITDFIKHKRIEHAVFFLENTDLSVMDISYKCGIFDLSYFTKLFKEEKGISPTEYRKELKLIK
ncbi:MAG: AraC family transcriptional regulator [Butyrivibrio sp.]|nr:AraC family transcriptional regulator [Butyrivibrio sp.]